jgi:uncharacterized membrane protein
VTTESTTDETVAERINRELDEMLQQIRVALPGVQVLFAFLLTVPFSNRFDSVNGAAETAFFIAFLATAMATAMLLAPVAYARIQFRQQDKERLLQLGTRTTVAGLVLLAIAIAASTFVVTQMLYSNVYAAVVAGLIAALLAGTWFVLPLLARRTASPDAPPARGA